MIGKVLGRSAIVAATLLAMAPAHATNFVFTNIGNGVSSVGGSYTMSSGGVTLTATAWSAGTLTSTPAKAKLGRYSGSAGGLGVTNVNENGSSPSHTIDNKDGYDFVMLTFSQAVNLSSLTKNNYQISGPTDGDYWYSFGSSSAITSGPGGTWAGYLSNMQTRNSSDAVASDPTNFSTVWLIGAARTKNEQNDGFKLSSVTVNITPQVPEPATWLTMILGFGAIGGMVRRRAQIAAKVRLFMANTLGRKLLTGPTA